MENRRTFVEAMTAPAIIVLGVGSIAVINNHQLSEVTQTAQENGCFPNNNNNLPPQDATDPLGYGDVVHGINKTIFFTTPLQYEYGIESGLEAKYEAQVAADDKGVHFDQNLPEKTLKKINKEDDEASNRLLAEEEAAAKDFLTSKGITVHVEGRTEAKNVRALVESGDEGDQFGDGANSLMLSVLAFLPEKVIEASGVTDIVLKSTADAYEVPVVDGSTMYIGDPLQVTEGLAEMVLNNCPDKSAVLSRLQEITNEAGASYTNIPPYRSKHYKAWSKQYGNDFFDSNDTSPEVEFDDLFSQAIMGWNVYSNVNTTLGEKQQLIQAIFDSVQPRGNNYETFYNIADEYGTQGMHPQVLDHALSNLFLEMAKAPNKAVAQYDLGVYAGIDYPTPILIQPRQPFHSKPLHLFPEPKS